MPVQGVTWRVVGSGPASRVILQKFQGGDTEAGSIVKATRRVYWPERVHSSKVGKPAPSGNPASARSCLASSGS